MVKNLGGNKNKKFGRKHMGQNNNNRKLRTKQDDEEMYACVTKMLGNGMCHIIGIDQITRLCIIRNKFRGRSKRQNMLNPGSWVLIGLRSWQTKQENSSKLETCDLLEVYNLNEVSQLKESLNENWSTFNGIGEVNREYHQETNDEEYEFDVGDDIDETTKQRLENEIQDYCEDGIETFVMNNEVIDIDDI